ncbi:MAG: hypothetical protein A3H96_17025 [Acidobacteria bacterium RIFCSPLOWO2_02_FULL_67_36]|nr:MAG: hypothetical protein A3H96_17025 [Acidobacteria bacterium RIFCSPLOWO2_02_FULL_67_36]OFW20634.1 MAG: hypothetical protein A3G21_22200 [Acidobacteria bacterium RIFCSPLOWO2_12_FULL_66_21]
MFRHLYLDDAMMRFKAGEDKSESLKIAGNSERVSIDIEMDAEPSDFVSESEESLDFVPYDPSTVDDRHRDQWLQTKLTPEALDHSLRRIDEQARTAIEEQGVNTLFMTLGMLQHKESRDSDTWFRAPLVFLPVQLTRKSARSGYTVAAADEDALVNPALIEWLCSNFGIVLPELPDSETISDTYDLQTFLKGAAQAVANQIGWAVQGDVYLGLFSFQKLVMFKDLEANGDAIGRHRLIRQLLARAGSSVHGLPDDIRQLQLDSDFTPESTYQVVDADSSQMRAAAAVSKGHDIVIEGPPGTGKSQTITNLVAQALAAGKSVLFVAEKMAALEVVHRRLVQAGIGEFCLELHSSKANKRAVMKGLSAALDASLQPIAGTTGTGHRLPVVRGALSDYVRAVHEPFGALGKSPYGVVGELGTVLQAPKIKLDADISKVTAEDLAAGRRALEDMEVHARAVGDPRLHPWRDARKTLYTEDDLDTAKALAVDIDDSVGILLTQVASASAAFGVPAGSTLDEAEGMAEVADVLGASPGVAAGILQSDAWNSPPREATTLLATGRKLRQLRERLRANLKDDVFDLQHSEDIAYIERKSSGVLSFFAILDARYRAINRRWVGWRRPGYVPSLLEQARVLKQVDEVSAVVHELAAAEKTGRALFGALWKAADSDWSRLDEYVAYVVRYRALAIGRGLAADAARLAEHRKPDVGALRTLAAGAQRLRMQLGELQNTVGWPDGYLQASPICEIGARAKAIATNLAKAPAWAAFESSRQRAVATIAHDVVDPGMSGAVPFDVLPSAFLRAFHMKWMSAVVQAREPLHQFDTLSHEAMVKDFRHLDQLVLQQNRAALAGMLRDRVQHKLRQPEGAASLPLLRRELVKQRKLRPLRRTLRDCDGAIRAIKPCFMMSPLTVAQYSDGSAPSFDVVIFDEASQLPTEDAVGAVVRGRQLVVVGDPKQLPPTNFFMVSGGSVDAVLGDDGTPLFDDTESVLEEFMGAAVPMSRLKWHYRSAHESLINFSNISFYDADLHTFPSAVTDSDTAGLEFRFVEGGVYEGKGVNLIEARRIADEVVSFAVAQLQRRAAGLNTLSLGVGTLNLRQQLAIVDELEVRRRADPSIEPFFDRSTNEPFFVKNLENIQGDERDAIFLSITYGRSPDGRVRYNFGPLNRDNGWRRLNVLVTRARRQMKVFSSIHDHDINPAGAVSEGPRLLRDFLSYAEHRRISGAVVSIAADTESPFERDVCLELARRGVRIQPQVGVCGYRVDVGILDDDVPGRFVCGIECDGVAYHSMETVRDRDRLRQQVLEDRGWIIHRVWSTDWFKDRQGQIDRLLQLIQESRECVRSQEEQHAHASSSSQEEHATGRSVDPVPTAAVPRTQYARPMVPAYEMFVAARTPSPVGLLDTALETLADVMTRIVDIEAPVHETDLIARVSGLWGTKAGSRIQTRIRQGARIAESQHRVHRRGPFYWRPDGRCQARCRTDSRIPGERIAPEEFAEAVKLVLAGGQALTKQSLIAETRAVMGYGRTGSILEQAIGNVVEALLSSGVLGEASGGLILRVTPGAGGAL